MLFITVSLNRNESWSTVPIWVRHLEGANILIAGPDRPERRATRLGVSKGIRRAYLTDVSDEEWAFVLPYLLLSREDNASRQHDLRALFDAVRYMVKTGNQW